MKASRKPPQNQDIKMISVIHQTNIDTCDQLKAKYLKRITAPLDGMWLGGFIPNAQHYSFHEDSNLVGYCCVNDDRYLLQFFLEDSHYNSGAALLEELLANNHKVLTDIAGAFVSTAEPDYLSICFDNFGEFNVHTYMYNLADHLNSEITNQNEKILRLVKPEQISEIVDFEVATLGMPEDWLQQYSSNLIKNKELFGYWNNNKLVAVGECRASKIPGYSDLGVIVDRNSRGKGLATRILQELSQITVAAGKKPICSTEIDNIGARRAIEKAGFLANNRIIQFKRPSVNCE
jgi:RimJ/RimL family protein N-acetyltransferase